MNAYVIVSAVVIVVLVLIVVFVLVQNVKDEEKLEKEMDEPVIKHPRHEPE